jgi:hypothetical protein
MSDDNATTSRQVLRLLDMEGLHPKILRAKLDSVPREVCRELVSELAAEAGELSGRIVFRLLLLDVPDARDQITTILLRSLRAEDPEARRGALYGLDQLDHPETAAAASGALADPSDAVVAQAVDILRRSAGEDPEIAARLRELAKSLSDRPDFHMSRGLLEAYGFSETGEGH